MNNYFHSVVLDSSKCNGCTNCMRGCPTEAIRIKDKKAVITQDRCIDCGECIRVCPYHAQNAITDELSALRNFKYNIAIVPMSLYGQFNVDTDMNRVFNGIKHIGFDYVIDEGSAADLLTIVIKENLKKNQLKRPVISSLCPAILRIIQFRFPSLIENIINVESPMEIAARMGKIKIMKEYGFKSEEIGVFYLSQCLAKVTSIHKPIGINKSYVNGAFSIKDLYGDIIKNTKLANSEDRYASALPLGIGWARAGGQSLAIGVENYIAVDGIENVINILEEIELGKLNNIDYFEGLACIGGCVGGPLNVENPFIAKNRIRTISKKKSNIKPEIYEYIDELHTRGLIGWTEKIQPRQVMILDKDIHKAMYKMELLKQIRAKLPGLDCGSCGAPSCNALAEDIVLEKASIDDCIFKLKEKIEYNE